MLERSRDVVRHLSALKRRAFDLRIDNLTAITAATSGHPGGTLSAMDIMQALFFGEMRHRPNEPHWAERDRFVLSKGHAVPALYTVLAHAGYFSRDLLPTLRRLGSPLQGHPANFITPGIEASTGSLGQGFSIAIGMALASKLDGDKFRVYSMIGDGESQEGQIWEAAMSAPKFALDNLVVILDHNKGQIDGFVDEVMSLNPIADKWRAFNWHVITCDGHDYASIRPRSPRRARPRASRRSSWRRPRKAKACRSWKARLAGTASRRRRRSWRTRCASCGPPRPRSSPTSKR